MKEPAWAPSRDLAGLLGQPWDGETRAPWVPPVHFYFQGTSRDLPQEDRALANEELTIWNFLLELLGIPHFLVGTVEPCGIFLTLGFQDTFQLLS